MPATTASRSLLGGIALLSATALALTGCATTAAEAETAETAAPTEITVEHAQGETVVPVDPETVVTFDLASLDTLTALGVEVTGVPDAALPEYLEGDYTPVGSLFEPDYEAVIALQPDLIIVAGRSASVYPQLAEIAPTIDLTVDGTDYFASARENAEILGEVFGEQDEIAAAFEDIDAKVADVRAAAEDAGTGLFLMSNAGEISAYGIGSRYGWLYEELGVTPAVENVEAASHGDPVSFEFVLEADPDHLFVLDRDAAIGQEGSQSAEQVLDNDVIARTTAAQNDAITYLSSTEWYIVGNGLTALDTMIGEVGKALS